MSVGQPNVQTRNQYGRDWGNYTDVAALPNTPGLIAPVNLLTPLETGDTALVRAYTQAGVIDPVTPPVPTGSTWTVGTLGGEDFPDLTTALASASVVNGDRLLLSAQTFTEAATITVSKSVTIQGAGLATTVVQTAGAAGDPVTLMSVTVSNVVLRDLTLKQRKTTNTSVEVALAITAGAGSSGHFLEAVRVETMEFGITLKSDGWQINNCELAYVGPNNSTRRLLAIYRSDGQGLFTNSTFDSGQNGVITGNTRVVVVTTGAAPPDEVLGGYLRVGNVTPSNAFPVSQFINIDSFQPGATPLKLVIDGCTSAETSAFLMFFTAGTQPPLGQCDFIAVQGNTLTNSHGKGAVALDGPAGVFAPGTTTFYASGNTLGATAFAAGWASGVDPSGGAAVDAQLGYHTTIWSDPNQPIEVGADQFICLSPGTPGLGDAVWRQTGQRYVPAAPTDWAGTPPLLVGDAVDRIASAVAGLLAGPIP